MTKALVLPRILLAELLLLLADLLLSLGVSMAERQHKKLTRRITLALLVLNRAACRLSDAASDSLG